MPRLSIVGMLAGMWRNVAPSPVSFADVREVEIVAAFEMLALVFGEHLVEVAFEFDVAEIPELDGHQVAVHPQHRRHPHCEMDVGTALGQSQLQKSV